MTRRSFLLGTAGILTAAKVFGRGIWFEAVLGGAPTLPSDRGESSLREHAAAKGLFYGAAMSRWGLADSAFQRVFVEQCGLLVPESELKWNTIHPGRGSFDFSASDKLLQFATRNGLLFRGHPLVWHNGMPGWFDSAANSSTAEQILRQHIAQVAGHYRGKMHSWDVVNESVFPWDKRGDGLRNTVWLQLIGPRYIDIAFQAAAEADPNVRLVYNETHLTAKHNDTSREAVLKLLQRLKSSGVPVHALGIQAHLRQDSRETEMDLKKIRHFLKDVAKLDLKIMITELDVNDEGLPPDPVARDNEVAAIYQDFLSAVLEEKGVTGVITWGLSDKYSWLRKKSGGDARPLPLDVSFRPKAAWNAIAHAFDGAPQR